MNESIITVSLPENYFSRLRKAQKAIKAHLDEKLTMPREFREILSPFEAANLEIWVLLEHLFDTGTKKRRINYAELNFYEPAPRERTRSKYESRRGFY